MTLRVRVSIVPFGDETQEREIEVINISNMGRAHKLKYEYAVEENQYKSIVPETPRVYHERTDGALVLVRKALEKLGY